MTDEDRIEQRNALVDLRGHIERIEEDFKFQPTIAESLADAWASVAEAIIELGVDWEQLMEEWNRGEPKGKNE